ncbi:tail length tape measure protein [Bacillus phage vB_BanS_Skywalker]|uniref:Tail tape measure protein n=1 Tax=Bacillus phage vB_BanS_Skywalker TaxID=2894789 RepID=A0AAE8YWI8_9CAUD|nr:tail length tape measure protein [Bacillus phage vB_BanS_Skywalker]UGO51228.1 tail tape measure protein [Bacillus phage vB_BanS_Skywalker]
MAGSNDLNISLKAQVVKLKVELDAKGSKLPQQVNNISKMLANNPVKLKVKLEAKLGDLTKQMKTISTSLQAKPMKLKVEIDVAGSTKNIKQQLKDVYKTVEDFNKKYGQQVKQMQQQMNQASSIKGKAQSGLNVPTNSKVQNFNNIKQYTAEIEKAKSILNGKFGDGIFKATQFKDAKGNLTGFVAELQKANGIVEKIKYSWNSNKSAFEIINRQTVDNTQKNAQSIQNTLKNLKNDINNLGKGADKGSLLTQLKDVQKALNTDGGKNFTKQMVADLQSAIKAEQQLVQATKAENQMLQQQAKLIADIKNNRNSATGALKNDLNGLLAQAGKASKAQDPSLEFKKIRQEMQGMINEQAKVNAKEKESQAILKQTIQLRRQLKDVLKTLPSDTADNKLKRSMVTEAIEATKLIRTYEQLGQAKKNFQKIADNKWMDADQNRARNLVESLRSVQQKLNDIGKSNPKLNQQMSFLDDRIVKKLSLNTQDIRNALTAYQRMLDTETQKIKQKEKNIKLGQNITDKFGGEAKVKNIEQQIFGSGTMSNKAIADLQRYIGTVERARVASISFGRDGIDSMGRSVKNMSVVFQGTGEHVRKVTYSMTQGSSQMRQVSDEMVRNVNRNLGAWEKFKVFMQSAPVWMLSQQMMTAPIQGLQAMTREILEVDKAMTELRRVASTDQNVDILFGNAVELSGKLGNNIHDIMKGMNEFARTFGDFNERQLTSITETATLMSNVSDLSVEEAQKSLVGTMNAFNIEASDSIRIVDALNEVDNDYAISTKQLAEGLQKSASAGKTFGVGLEENIGHITAIGAVTMESGAIIGNSLKTIYSRMTTMKDSEQTLRNVGIAMYEIGENGVKSVKPVSQIMNELGDRWKTLTKEEQQNIAVKIAGRNQLTRFLAVMNNYDMAVKATNTAYQSQGSAMRENEKYLQSFEAKINKLKNGFTEMSLAIGKAFLSGGILMAINGLGALAKGITGVAQSFGALSGVGLILGAVMAKMGAFQGLFGRMGATVGVFKQGMAETTRTMGAQATALDKFKGGMQGVITTSTGGVGVMKSLGGALAGFGRSLMGMLGMGAVFMGIGMAIEFLIGKYQKAKQEQEALDKSINQTVNAYRKSADGLEGLLAKYEAFEKAGDSIKKGSKEYEEFMLVQTKLSQAMPNMIKSVDAQGQAWMKSSKELREHLKLTKDLSQAQANRTNKRFAENVEKEAESLRKLVEEEKKLKAERDKIKTGSVDWKAGTGGASKEERAQAQMAYEKGMADLVWKRLDATQKTTAKIQEQSRAYLEAKGSLAKMGEGAQLVVDKFATMNSDKLKKLVEDGASESKINSMIKKITEGGNQMGDVFAKAFDKMTQGIDSGTLKGSQKIESIKQQLSSIGKAIPDDFFDVKNLDDLDKAKENMEKLIDVGMRIKSSNGGTFDQLAKEAEKYGLSADQAREFVTKLGMESANAELRNRALEESQTGVSSAMEGTGGAVDDATGALKDYKEAVIDAIDAQKELFGYKNEELGNMQGHLEALKTAQLLYGENAKGTQLWAESGAKLSEFLGVSKDQVYENIDGLHETISVMQEIGVKYDESGKLALDWGSATEGQINRFRESVAKYGLDVDLLTGKTRTFGHGIKEQGQILDENGNRIDQAGDKAKSGGDKFNEAGDKAKEGGDKANEAGDKFNEAGDKVGSSGSKFQPFIQEMEKLGQLSGQTGQQVIEGLQKINLADFSQVKAKGDELGLTMEGVIEYAKKAGAITPEEMAKIGNSGEKLSLLENKMKDLGFDEFTGKSSETAGKIEGDMNRIGNSGAPLSIIEQKMKDLGFDEASTKSGETATKVEGDMNRIGNSGGSLNLLEQKMRDLGFDEASAKSGETAGKIEGDVNRIANSGGNLAPLKENVKQVGTAMDETKTQVEGSVSGINTSFSTLGQGINTGFQPFKTSAQLFTEQLQGMSRQSGTSAQEIQGHVTTIGNAKNALDQYKIAVDNVKTSMNGMATEVTGTATGLSQFGMAFAGAGQAMSGFQTSMSGVRGEMSNVVSQASGTAQSLEGIGQSMSSASVSGSAFVGAMNGVGASCSLASQSMANMGSASATASSGLASATQASQASANASQNNASAKNAEASASQNSATASFGVANAKQAEASAIMSAISATQNMASAYSAMASAGISSISSIVGAISSYMMAVFAMASGTMQASSAIKGAFSSMVGTVVGSTGAMNSAHNSQASALNKVRDAANSAKSAVQGLNSTISGAMTNLSNYIAKAQQASNVQVKAPSLPPLPTGATWTMQSVTNLMADTGNGEVASAVTSFGSAMSSALGSFSASSGDSGSIGGGGGTSGTIIPSIYTGYNSYGVFGALASYDDSFEENDRTDPNRHKKGYVQAEDGSWVKESFYETPKMKSSADESDKLADATPWSTYERSMKEMDVTLKWMEAKMKSMNKNTAEYRKMMNDIYQVEIKRWELLNHDLWDKERRNEQIKRELEGLKNINSHTKEQREQYNKLWSEYESNLSSITSMRAEWQEFLDNWEQRYADILKAHVDAIVEAYTKGLEEIKGKVDDIDFNISVAELTDPNNMTKMMNLYIEKAQQLKLEKKKLEDQQRDLTLKLYEAEDKFGKDSKVAQEVKAEIDKVKEAWEDSALAVLQAEKEIKDARADVADKGIDQLKNYYKNMKDMAIDAIDKEQENLKKAHEAKMKLYDKEIDKINNVYDTKLKQMDKDKDESNYQEELSNKNKERADLQNKISILSKDTSLSGKKKLEEMKKELAEMDKEIAKFQQERQDELMRQALEDQKEQQIKEIEDKKKAEEEVLNGKVEELDKEKDNVSTKYDDLIDNEKRWADMRDQFIKGNFQTLNDELQKMQQQINNMNNGVFDGLTPSFKDFSDETKKQVQDANDMVVDNMDFNLQDPKSDVEELIKSKGYQTFESEVVRPDDPARPMKPAPEPPPTPPAQVKPPIPPSQMPTKGNVTGVTSDSYLNIRNAPNMQGGVIRRILNGANVQILGEEGDWWKVKFSNSRGTSTGFANKKYIKAFDTGGYTGDWSGNGGKMAMLHKKEQVLNANDTKNLFDTVKLVDKVKDYLPNFKANNMARQFVGDGGVSGMNVENNYYLDVNIESMNGTKDQAKSVTSEIIKGLKKMGK